MSTSKKSQKYLVPRLQLGTMLGRLPLPQAERLPAPALKDDSNSDDSDSDDSDDSNLTARYIKMEREIKEKAAKAAENANTARKAAAQAATRRFRQKGRRRVTSRVDSDKTAKDMLIMTSRAASSAEAIARELANKAKKIQDHNTAVSNAKERMKLLAPKYQEELNRFTQKKPSNWSKLKKRVKQMFSARKSKLRGRNSGGAKKGKKKRQGTSSSSSKESRSAQSQGTVKLDPQIEAGWDFFLKIENVLGDISSFEDEYYAFKQGTQSDSEYWKEIINEFVTKADEPELLDHLKSLSFKRFEEKLKAQTLLDRGK